ncbi:MAG: ribosome maturation factor RimM [Tannerellaceae bacterium]|nr:ribosome maturation factor RimM [Tannerellaceae bacterium]
MIRKEEVFKIGQFAKPHGTKGEIGLITQSELFDESEDPYLICEIDGILVPFFIEEYRPKTNTVILVKMEQVDSEEAAREFTGREVFFPLDEIPEEKELVGDITWDNFIGYRVTDEEKGGLGVITGVDESTLNVLLKIDYQGDELLIPAVDEIILSADHTEKHLIVKVPEGLLDL